MAKFQFDSPLKLKGDVVVSTLDDAAAFMRWLKHPKLIRTRDSCCASLSAPATVRNDTSQQISFEFGPSRKASS
jgi:hypothetical protein